jgi:hypothetical protein
VTLGPPFLEPGLTQFRATATRSKVIGAHFNDNQGFQKADAEFLWPYCPRKDGGTTDLRCCASEPVSGGFTAHLMDPERAQTSFLAWSPRTKVLFGYVCQRKDFSWLGRWEENHLRTAPPWNGRGLTAAWSLAFRRCWNHADEWWSAEVCSACLPTDGFPPKAV